MHRNARLYLILILAMLAGPVLADADPSLSEVYEAARAGHLERAQQMMNEVLRDHPRSAKAHYVKAELYVKAGNLAMGRQELNIAQSLEPGLPFATPDSVRALQTNLSRTQSVQAHPAPLQTGSSFSWLALALVVLVGVVLWVAFRGRRSPGNVYSQPREAMAAPAAAPGTVATAGVPPSAGAAVGTGVAGGLVSGLAAGAGIVAGEEIARHLLGSGRREDDTPIASEPGRVLENDDPDAPDFGVSGGNSWDDGPGLDGGSGNDDWS